MNAENALKGAMGACDAVKGAFSASHALNAPFSTTTDATTAEIMDYDEVLARFDPVLGLEVHVELNTKTKMFCGCENVFGGEPNTHVCPTCLGLPGSLPVVNAKAIESAILIGLALNCEIASWCRFARKNYFYPDQPKNFQTSQYDEPIAFNGYLDVTLDDGEVVRVEIERAHMEEDTGKSLHVGGATGRIHGADYSLLDYNRAGVPLIEIVTKIIPETGARAPEVARAYVSALRDLLRALNVSDVRMDQGSLRCDANVSLKPKNQTELGTRTETKNVNSLRSVERAVRYEMMRHGAILAQGGEIRQETRHFQESDGTTSAGRAKETAEDYRYFPEPDLTPVAPSRDWVEQLRASLPEMPAERRKRIQTEWNLSDAELRDLINAGAVELIAATVDAGASSADARGWWVAYLTQQANAQGVELAELSITPDQVAKVIAMVNEGSLTNTLAKQVVDGVLAGEGEPSEIVEKRGLRVVSDDSALMVAIDEALAAQPDVVEKIRGGKVAAAGAIVGSVMKATQGKADAKRVRELIVERVGA
jgi:aspartyl-tRNA(Asn)/glutamyl-tRNA(Gln) amidotransferase subunit B